MMNLIVFPSTHQPHYLDQIKGLLGKKFVNFKVQMCSSKKNITLHKGSIIILELSLYSDLYFIKHITPCVPNIIVIVSSVELLRLALNEDLPALLIHPFTNEEFLYALKKIMIKMELNIDDEMEDNSTVEISSTTPTKLPQKETRYYDNQKILTERQMELLMSISHGYLYKEIAIKYGITVGTVKQHLHKIYDKLNVSNKVEAINKVGLHMIA